MIVHIGTMAATARVILCALLASLIAVTPLGAHVRLALPSGEFVPDLCTVVASPERPPASPTQSPSHPDVHLQCGDCTTCGIAFAEHASPLIPAILIAGVPLETFGLAAPVESFGGGIVARPRGPPAPG